MKDTTPGSHQHGRHTHGTNEKIGKEAALEVENRMLLEQNAALQRTLHEIQNELRTLRANDLGAHLRDGMNAPRPRTRR